MECDYNIYFRNHRRGHRIISVPILKNTCSCCDERDTCRISIFNDNIHQDELDKELKYDLVQYQKYLNDSMDRYKSIENDIRKGKYKNKYVCELVKLSDAPLTAMVMDDTEKITVREYLKKHPDHINRKRVLGIREIKNVCDVVRGLNKEEIKEDLKYVEEELNKLR